MIFVSDIACPWCAVGLGNLEKALFELQDNVNAEIHFRPFELNPNMPKGGQDTIEHLTQKYGMSEQQVKENQAQIRARAIEAGFDFNPEVRKRIYNTLDCHRLLDWAAKEYGLAKQLALKKELLKTYFCLAVDLDDHANLIDAVDKAGLDRHRAQEVLNGNEFFNNVRDEEQIYKSVGIHSVPSIILNDQYLLQGAQPPESFIDVFNQIIQKS